jgi:two-component system, sensor histidine kinase
MSTTIPLIIVAGFLLLFVVLWIISLRKVSAITKFLHEKDLKISELENRIDQLQENEPDPGDEQNKDDIERVKNTIELTLKKALKRSEEENFQKNAFLANLSSEIRTPLNNIIGFASLLETEISLMENKELFDYARGISESGDRLINLLNNIIDISKIESHDVDINIKPCEVSPIISNVAQLYIFKANDQQIKFNVINKEIPEALIDDKVLTRVLGSIVDNAIKYTQKGFVNISTGYKNKSKRAFIRVRDSGSGIDPEYLKDIFNPFRQEGPGYNKEEQGSRLGLPIARRLMEMMDGALEIESERGKGTTVTLFLTTEVSSIEEIKEDEIQTPVAPKEPEKTRKPVQLKGLDIFIVEDDLMNSMVLVQMTKALGEVTTAVNGESTLQIIENREKQKKRFDIMLFDINLPPPYDGIQLMKKVRKQYPEYKSIPFVAQTAYAMAGDREKLLEEGFDDYIAKPINKNELLTIIKNQLQIHQK